MFGKLALIALLGLTAAAEEAEEAPWVQKSQTKGVTVYHRDRADSKIKEVKAVGEIDAPPRKVLEVLADYPRYVEIMPYTKVSEVLATEKDGKVAHVYTVIDAPLASDRDYTLRIEEVSDWRDGKGYLRTRWSPSDKGPAKKKGMVRVETNDGSWTLEPIAGGKRTRGTYLLFTDPGGSLTTWIINKANSSAIPDIFEALRKHAGDEKYAGKK